MLDWHGLSKQGIESATGAEPSSLAFVKPEIVIDPEATRCGRYEHECEDCSARHVCVLIDRSFGIRNLHNCIDRVYDHALNTIGRTQWNVDKQSEQ